MLEEICIRRRAGRKFDPGSVFKSRWTILTSLSPCDGQILDGCFNRGVKLVEEIPSGRLCVLKMLLPDITSPDHAACEIRILRKLARYGGGGGHANIVRLLDWDDGSKHPHDIPWLVANFCDRGTLAQLIKMYGDRGMYLPEAFIWHAFESLVEAARFCHSQSVVHRDITLSNVFLQSSGMKETYPTIQLGDFGCAATREDIAALSHGDRFPGNPRYRPPEGCETHPACDVYHIGLVIMCLYMCDLNPTESLGDFFHGQDMNSSKRYSCELRSLIQGCLEVSREERPRAEMLVRSIRRLRVEMPGTPLPFEDLMHREEVVAP